MNQVLKLWSRVGVRVLTLVAIIALALPLAASGQDTGPDKPSTCKWNARIPRPRVWWSVGWTRLRLRARHR